MDESISRAEEAAGDSVHDALHRIDVLMHGSRRLERVFDYVQRHYFEPLQLDHVASVASLERVYFCKYIRRQIGIPFGSWLRMVRVERAVHLLRTTRMTVADIALSVGFGDAGGLQRSCKRVTGFSPRAIRAIWTIPAATRSDALK